MNVCLNLNKQLYFEIFIPLKIKKNEKMVSKAKINKEKSKNNTALFPS